MGGFLTLLAPLWIGQLVDSAVPSGNASQLLWITLGLIAAAVAAGWVQLVQSFALLRLEAHADSSLQAAMMDRLLSLPTPFFRHYTTGDLATRVMGINAIRNLLTGTVLQALLGSVFSFLSLTILLRYEMRMALTALMLTAVTVLVMLLLSVIQMRFIRPLLLQQSVLAGFILQFLSGITKIRMTGTESRAFRLWAQVYARQRQTLLQARSVGIALQVFQAGWLPFTSLVLFSTVLFSHNQDFSTGHFLTYNAAFGQFLLGALGLTMALGSLLQAIPYYELARPILETKPEVSEQSLSPGELTGHLRISRVRFRYTPDSPPVLQDVSLSAEPGEFIAIVGSSGAGKSSLLRILMGLDTPESGAVFYDGKDLATLDIQAVRRQMGIVLQNSRLMTGNIFLNIVGTSSLTMEDAWEAARLVGLDRDIKKMPMGMYSVVGEGGGTYSGGQRQRLIIARAIAHRPHLILFDEATSALDNRTQAIITQSLEQLQATRIVVAHRLSTIEKADRIYVLDQGRVVQVGTYQELAKQPGVFADLVKRQTN
jgi:ATP-binding cassette subfamily C protein